MNGRFFIERPVFAGVLSILLVLMGGVAWFRLPVEQYPELAPPVVRVEAFYPGASAQTIADTIAAPIEQQVNGVDGMIYMTSTSADGRYALDVSFEKGTDPDLAAVKVQNRVNAAEPRLPEDVRRQGITAKKQSTSFVGVIAVWSEDGRYDDLFLSNYISISMKDEVARIPGVGGVNVLPAKDYGMRIWLDPDALRARGLTMTDVNTAIREQNVQVAAGVVGRQPAPTGTDFELIVSTEGRLKTPEQFAEIIVKRDALGGVVRVKDVGRVELGSQDYTTIARFNGKSASCFGLVLAIGIVVDDAIVVVENVERNIAKGLAPREAAIQAMKEVSGAVIAVALVLCAVFVPTAFVSGITGQFYKQFALTIAVSTVISAFNSLTLSPALCAILLQPHGAKTDWLTKLINLFFGWFFRLFNKVFDFSSSLYAGLVRKLIRLALLVILGYGGLLFLTQKVFNTVPGGYIPAQDMGYAIVLVQLPDAAAFDRTDAVVRKMDRMAQQIPGIAHTFAISGYSSVLQANQPNVGAAFLVFDDFDKRTSPEMKGDRLLASIREKFATIQEGRVLVLPPPPLRGLGNAGGFKIQVQDLNNAGLDALEAATQKLLAAAQNEPGLISLVTGFRARTPQFKLEINRAQAKTMGVSLGRFERGAAGLSRLRLCERLQFVRPHLSGHRAGRSRVPQRSRRCLPHQDPQSKRRHGAARSLGQSHQDGRSRPRAALQPLLLRRHQRQHAPRHQLQPDDRKDRAPRQRAPAHRFRHRVDRSHLPADPRRQHAHLHLPAVRHLRLPGARRAV
jgi:multidrug efflux pump subunit AcrB